MDYFTGKFETSGSNFSQEIRKAKLLASKCYSDTLNITKQWGKYFSEVAKITSAMMADVIRKIRDQGSNFRYETARSATVLAIFLISKFIKYT